MAFKSPVKMSYVVKSAVTRDLILLYAPASMSQYIANLWY